MLLRTLLFTGLLVSGAALAQSDPQPAPPPPAPPMPPAGAGHLPDTRDTQIETELAAARDRLQEAAREVAELSSQLNRPFVQRFSGFKEFPRAIIGVQLDPSGGKDGARVLEVSPGGPAADAGIRAGDVIVGVNGTEVKGEDAAREIVKAIREVKPDSKLDLRVLRDGKTRVVTVTARPGPVVMAMGVPFPQIPPLPAAGPFFITQGHLSDMELASLTPQLGKYFGTDKGVLVVRAPSDGVLKLEDGDVILSIDGREPKNGSHATRILGSYQPGEKIKLRIVRQHKNVDLETTVPEDARKDMMFHSQGPETGPLPDKGGIMRREGDAT